MKASKATPVGTESAPGTHPDVLLKTLYVACEAVPDQVSVSSLSERPTVITVVIDTILSICGFVVVKITFTKSTLYTET